VALVGILALMQLRIMENLQQKNIIRSSFEFVRLPKIKFEEYYNTYPLNLLIDFDTLMIQKERQNY
jgi:hypothetical protein